MTGFVSLYQQNLGIEDGRQPGHSESKKTRPFRERGILKEDCYPGKSILPRSTATKFAREKKQEGKRRKRLLPKVVCFVSSGIARRDLRDRRGDLHPYQS